MTVANTTVNGKNDVRDGKGTFEYANGDKYVGDWKEDMQHGKGIYFFHGRPLRRFLCAG